MGLEGVRMQMFKTYEREDSIVFSDFTCIVGPNGAGKSNIVDAILFALAADTDSLRGEVVRRKSGAPSTFVELAYRNSQGVLQYLKRELRGRASVYCIDQKRVALQDYIAYLKGQHILTAHRNFLISQNDIMIRSPKELTRLLEEVSGSGTYRQKYAEAKERKEAAQQRNHEALNRKKLALGAQQDLQLVLEKTEKYHRLKEKRARILVASLSRRKAEIEKTRKDLQNKIEEIREQEEDANADEVRAARLQTHLAKLSAKKRALEAMAQREDQKDQIENELKALYHHRDSLLERQSEALAQIEEARWQQKKLQEQRDKQEDLSASRKELLLSALSHIQEVDTALGLPQLRMSVAELQQRSQEQKKPNELHPRDSEASSVEIRPREAALSLLNSSLLQVLKQISDHSSRKTEIAALSRLKYFTEQLKPRVPEILGVLYDLISPSLPVFARAFQALSHGKRSTVLLSSESAARAVLAGLSDAGAGRIGVLAITRCPVSCPRCKSRDAVLVRAFPQESDAEQIRAERIVNIDPRARPYACSLLKYVCGNTLVQLSQSVPSLHGHSLVTLDGIRISSHGVLKKIPGEGAGADLRDLEKKRDELLQQIKEEGASLAKEKENAQNTNVCPAESKIDALLREKKQELEIAESEAENQKKAFLERAGISPAEVKGMLEREPGGATAVKKRAQQLRKKEEMWTSSLREVTKLLQESEQHVREKEEELAAVHEPQMRNQKQNMLEQIRQEISSVEDQLLAHARTSARSSARVQRRVLTEQIHALDDEIEEIQQCAAEEALELSSGSDTADDEKRSGIGDEDNGKNNGNGSTYGSDEKNSSIAEPEISLEGMQAEIKQLEAELASRACTTSTADRRAFEKAVSEAEESRTQLQDALRAFQDVRALRKAAFLTVFDRVNAEFSAHFARLSRAPESSARAHLGLEVPIEPYLGGTSVHVMPTGRTFRDAKYLSGGERTTAALALLLSLHSFSPAPFYVFDEMEAALDRDKIFALRESLQESSHAQFICVTHRIELFSTADTLIGVARPPGRPSQVLSLRVYEEGARR